MSVYRIEDGRVTEAMTPELEAALAEVSACAYGLTDPLTIRAAIERLEEVMAELPEVEQPLEHAFTDGLYRRTILNPKGSVIVTKLHKEPNFSFVVAGRILALTENGPRMIEAPEMFITEPGTKRVIFALEETIFSTVHPNPTNTRDLEELESRIIAKNWDELEVLGSLAPPTLEG